MNLTKKNKIIISAVSGAAAVAVIVTVVLLAGGKTPLPVTPDSETSTPSSGVVVNLPTDDPTETESPAPTESEKDDKLVIDVGGDPESPASTPNNGGNNDNPVKTPDKPVDTKKPEQPANNDNGGGLVIGGGDAAGDEQKAAIEAWLRNLELEGCQYCGSHSCPSFYAKDEWGNPSLDVTLCPKYDERKDPIKYCQYSGKRTGDGTNGTCVRFVNDTHCPNCGKFVKANTCHTCDD